MKQTNKATSFKQQLKLMIQIQHQYIKKIYKVKKRRKKYKITQL